MKKLELYALPEDSGRRIDLFVSEKLPDLTRSTIQRLCGEGGVLISGRPASKSERLRGGEAVEVFLPDPKPALPAAQSIPLDIIWEDAHLLVINKRQGMVVHPAPGNQDGTLVNALLYHCGEDFSGIGGVERPGIVHRIDKMTSGLLLVAKTQAAHNALSSQIKAHSIRRVYECVVHGSFKEDEGVINAPIGRHPIERKKMCVTDKNAKSALTRFRVLARYKGFSHLEVTLETGRTHQIRVHMAHKGHPVAGDMVYGPQKGVRQLDGQCLHARTLGFNHPATNEYMELTSRLPDYFLQFISTLGKES